jgi:ABC-type multidrug transport system fused ATPase/permease subunit
MDQLSVEKRNKLFKDREKDLTLKRDIKDKLSALYSNIRMAMFLSGVVGGGILFYFDRKTIAIAVFLVFAILFAITAIRHQALKKELLYLATLLDIHAEYKARNVHDFGKLPDTGENFKDPNHIYSDDLDLFGPRSLFHLMSTAETWFGRRSFADLLLSAAYKNKDVRMITKRQEAAAELGGNLEVLERMQASGRIASRSAEDPGKLLRYVKEGADKPLISKAFLVLSALVTLAFLLSAILVFAFQLIPPFVFLALAVVQIILVALKYQKFKPAFESVGDFYAEISAYTKLFADIEKSDLSSDYLTEIRNTLKGSGDSSSASASKRVKTLRKISLFIQARSQPILFFVLNVCFLYDNYCIYFLEKWKRESGSHLEEYLTALGMWEALMSLSTLTFVYPECSFPSFVKEEDEHQASFEAVRMGHPLIPVDRQIRNDFSLRSGTALITGSNMSGKTTLLRTVGVNAVLAYAGTICCADSLILGRMQIASSMRIADDLAEGLSTFYAELLRIGAIIEKSREEAPLLYLIDEIFRGTNSRDRTDGAKIVLKNLNNPWIIGLMSTHDYELCSPEVQSGMNLKNYHFSETYDETGIHFDYQLTEGVSVSANARYLMRMIGIE